MSKWAVQHSSKRQDWATPLHVFRDLDSEFKFSLDAAASSSNAKCAKYINEEMNSLLCDWFELSHGGAVWLNPPYGRSIGVWIEKAFLESQKGCTVVCLTFSRTCTRWWHSYAMKAAEIRFIKRRLRFVGAQASAPAPSCILVFRHSANDLKVTSQGFAK